MKRRVWWGGGVVGGWAGQLPPGFPDAREKPKRLPDGRLQNEAILREDFERNLRDLERMEELLEEAERALEKAAAGGAPRRVGQALEEVEKISKRISGRLRRY
jgi:hypothetical protein